MSGRTFREVAADFLVDHRIDTVCPRTLHSQVSVLNATFGDVPLELIDAAAIKKWIGARLDAGVSKATINRNRSALSIIFAWAIDKGELQEPNPIRGIRAFKEGVGRTRYLSPEETARLLLAAAPHLKTALMLAIHTGARLHEVLSLSWIDVDFDAGVVTFRRETTKARKTRHVPMSADLRAHLAALPGRSAATSVVLYEGRPLKCIKGAFEHARTKAGLGRDVTFHTTRHTCASFFVQRSGSIYDLKQILGHSDIKLTERYAHLSPEHIRRCAELLGPPRAKRREEDQA